MKKNFLTMVFFLFVLFTLPSCNRESKVSTPPSSETETPVIEEPNIDEKEVSEEELSEDDPNKITSPLDGLKYYKEDLAKRPVAVSIDNHPRARWQAGLSQAEIIYEFEVENPYTRYLCIFLAKEPERVGPVRSARPYIIYYALENDGIFVHVGGSEDAFSEISRLSAADIDGLYSSSMWRYYETNKSAPHNMYTTLKQIRAEADKKGYKSDASFEGYSFYKKNTSLSEKYNASKAEKINITYNKDNTTDYTYDKEKKKYFRFKDCEKHIDELNNQQLTAKNIIIIEAAKKILDNAGRLYLGTIGKGNGLYITNGQSIPITWEKKSEKGRTRFFANGEELTMNPGNTWIQVINRLSSVKIE